MMQQILGFVASHHQLLEGAVFGFALAHVPQAVAMAFHLAMKVPFLRNAVVSNPDRAKALIKAIEAELEKDIDEEAAAPAAAPVAAPAK